MTMINYKQRSEKAKVTRMLLDYKMKRWSLWKRLKAQMITWEEYWKERHELDALHPEQARTVNEQTHEGV